MNEGTVDKDKDKSGREPDLEEPQTGERSRRDFLRTGTIGAASLAGAVALGAHASHAEAKKRRGSGGSGKRRVAILVDAETHMMPDLARELARRDHNLVIGNSADGLGKELKGMGAEVADLGRGLDLAKQETYEKLVGAAKDKFGGFDSACIRTGAHGTGTILEAKPEDAQVQFEGNFLQAFLALHVLLPPLVAQKSGQVVINTSASGLRPAPSATLYSSLRAGANALVRCAGQTVGAHGVTVNATGTYAMDYPSFLEDVGALDNPERRKEVEAEIPVKRLCKPTEAAHFVAGLLDGKNMFQTSQFFAIDGGWCFE